MTEGLRFRDRRDAGHRLGDALRHLAGVDLHAGVVVLGLPRGGVPVAAEVARALDAPLDVFVVRKLGVPGQPEVAMGAIASGGVTVLNHDTIALADVPPSEIDAAMRREEGELARRERAYRGARPSVDVTGATVIVVDDGMATGATMRAAVSALRRCSAWPIAASAFWSPRHSIASGSGTPTSPK